ncbi:361_t:CDS:2, partial [Dentiscutata heterogama]
MGIYSCEWDLDNYIGNGYLLGNNASIHLPFFMKRTFTSHDVILGRKFVHGISLIFLAIDMSGSAFSTLSLAFRPPPFDADHSNGQENNHNNETVVEITLKTESSEHDEKID